MRAIREGESSKKKVLNSCLLLDLSYTAGIIVPTFSVPRAVQQLQLIFLHYADVTDASSLVGG
jgi:hypothetical protein